MVSISLVARTSVVRSSLLFGAILSLALLLFTFYQLFSYQSSEVPLPMGITRTRHKNSTSEVFAAQFPKIVHNMWKSASLPPPTETLRWKKVIYIVLWYFF
jgi:hypothetical protein